MIGLSCECRYCKLIHFVYMVNKYIYLIFFQRKPDTDCPRQLKVNEILRLIQARILGAGLRLSNKALWDSLNEQEEGQQEYSPYATLPHKLTDGERKGWIKMIEERCEPIAFPKPILLYIS